MLNFTVEEFRDVLIETLKGYPVDNPSTNYERQEEELLTIDDACQILKVSKPTLRELTVKGVLRSYKINSRVRYKLSEVMDSLNEVKFKKV